MLGGGQDPFILATPPQPGKKSCFEHHAYDLLTNLYSEYLCSSFGFLLPLSSQLVGLHAVFAMDDGDGCNGNNKLLYRNNETKENHKTACPWPNTSSTPRGEHAYTTHWHFTNTAPTLHRHFADTFEKFFEISKNSRKF